MKTKKTISLLLAIVMTLSLGVAAFADDEINYNWTPIPTSPEGLAKGAYYIDWTDALTTESQEWGNVSAEDLARTIEIYNSGTWFIDYDVPALKGSYVIPADLSGTGEAVTEEMPVEGATARLRFLIHEVGEEWIPVAKSTEGLSVGDWYIDLTRAAEIGDDWDQCDFYVNANSDSRYMKYKAVLAADGTCTYYLPLFNYINFYLDICPIRQYDGCSWTPIPTSADGLSVGDYYLDFTYDWNAWSPDVRQARLDMWNAGEWYVDHTNRMVKGSFTVPADQSETGESFVTVYEPFTQDSYNLYAAALMRVGQWAKLPASADGLSAGDAYMDVAALAAVLHTSEADLNGVEYYKDAVSGDVYLTSEGYVRMYLGSDPAVLGCIKTVPAPVEPEEPDQPEQEKPTLWKRIVSFFLRIVDFFKKMFAK